MTKAALQSATHDRFGFIPLSPLARSRIWPGLLPYSIADHGAQGGSQVAADDASIAPDARPRLPRGVRLTHNEAQGGWVLLAPERIFKADAIAAEILKRCTGEATLAAIVDDLAQTYSAPRERIMADVTKLLSGLVDKKLLAL